MRPFSSSLFGQSARLSQILSMKTGLLNPNWSTVEQFWYSLGEKSGSSLSEVILTFIGMNICEKNRIMLKLTSVPYSSATGLARRQLSS